MFLFVGCNIKNTKIQTSNTKNTKIKDQMPEIKPKDFNFVLNYGVNAKNQLDTIKGQYTLDMIKDQSVTTNLKLTNEEMNIIYSEMKKINILDYPDKFTPKGNLNKTPFFTYSIKIILNGKEKTIYWENQNGSETKEAKQLKEIFNKIHEIIIKKEEFKKLPKPQGGYA